MHTVCRRFGWARNVSAYLASSCMTSAPVRLSAQEPYSPKNRALVVALFQNNKEGLDGSDAQILVVIRAGFREDRQQVLHDALLDEVAADDEDVRHGVDVPLVVGSQLLCHANGVVAELLLPELVSFNAQGFNERLHDAFDEAERLRPQRRIRVLKAVNDRHLIPVADRRPDPDDRVQGLDADVLGVQRDAFRGQQPIDKGGALLKESVVGIDGRRTLDAFVHHGVRGVDAHVGAPHDLYEHFVHALGSVLVALPEKGQQSHNLHRDPRRGHPMIIELLRQAVLDDLLRDADQAGHEILEEVGVLPDEILQSRKRARHDRGLRVTESAPEGIRRLHDDAVVEHRERMERAQRLLAHVRVVMAGEPHDKPNKRGHHLWGGESRSGLERARDLQEVARRQIPLHLSVVGRWWSRQAWSLVSSGTSPVPG
eukprot:scaffold7341_cov229-Pinguiococcus_pyrenoidosus.AAC.3